jgi:PAS domain S-box-containing protein
MNLKRFHGLNVATKFQLSFIKPDQVVCYTEAVIHAYCDNTMSNYDDILRECSKDNESYHRLRTLVDTMSDQFDTATHQHAQDIERLENLLVSQNSYVLGAQQITLDLLNHRDLSELLQAIVDNATSILDAPYGEIMLREGDVLGVRAFTANQPMLIGDRVKRGEAEISWRAVDTKQPVIYDDYQTWSRRRSIYEPLKLHAVADFPIVIDDECVGVLAVARDQPNYPFTPDQVKNGVWLAQLAALALDVTLLHDAAQLEIREHQYTEMALRESEAAAQQFQDDLKKLHEINLELSSMQSLDDLFQRTIELTRSRLNIDRIGLFVIDPEKNELVGTFGVDTRGMLRDEHEYRETITPNHWTKAINNAPNRVIFWPHAHQYDLRKFVGEGWKIGAGLWDGQSVVGYISTDNLISHRPARPYETELLSLLASTVGHLVAVHRANDALRRNEAQMRYLFQNSHVMFTHLKMNPDGTWGRLFTSETGARLSGYTQEQLINRDFWLAHIHPDDVATFQQPTGSYSGQTPGSFEYRFKFADGRYHWIHADTIPLPAAPDGLPEFLSTGIDITERKEAQEALRQSEERLRFLMTNAPLMLYSYRMRTDKSMEPIQFVGQLPYQGKEHQAGLLEPEDLFSAIHEEDLPGFLDDGLPYNAPLRKSEYRIRVRDGSYRWIYAESLLTHDIPGEAAEYVGYLIDITERKRLEEVLLQEEVLRVALAKEHELSELKSQIMARIAHEFRTPLSIIHTASDMIERYFERMPPQKRSEQTKKIRVGVYRITHILDEINRIMRSDDDPSELMYGLVDLEWLTSSVIVGLRDEDAPARIINVGIDPSARKFLSDADKLRSILTNLLSNAIKFSPESQPITILATGSAEHVIIKVCDRGIGIPENELEQVVEAFYRAQNIGEVEGIGLGLTVVHDAVKRLGGSLKIESSPNQGTTVSVILPQGASRHQEAK